MIKSVPGPDRNPRRPALTLPPLSCDCHCHVFGPVARFPYYEGRNYTPPDATYEDLSSLMGVLGVERAVIVQPSVYGNDNACTEDAIARLDGRGRGVAVIDPEISDAELQRLDDAGFRGARLNLYHPGGSTPLDQLEAIAAKVASVGWHVQIYLQGRNLPELLPRLQALPTPIVIDHLGHMEYDQGLDQPGFQALLRLLEGGKSWVKLCAYRFDYGGAPFPTAAPFVRALYEAAPQRIVWGTDWPHPDVAGKEKGEPGIMPNDGDLVDALRFWFDDDKAIQQILVDNPGVLYGFE